MDYNNINNSNYSYTGNSTNNWSSEEEYYYEEVQEEHDVWDDSGNYYGTNGSYEGEEWDEEEWDDDQQQQLIDIRYFEDLTPAEQKEMREWAKFIVIAEPLTLVWVLLLYLMMAVVGDFFFGGEWRVVLVSHPGLDEWKDPDGYEFRHEFFSHYLPFGVSVLCLLMAMYAGFCLECCMPPLDTPDSTHYQTMKVIGPVIYLTKHGLYAQIWHALFTSIVWGGIAFMGLGDTDMSPQTYLVLEEKELDSWPYESPEAAKELNEDLLRRWNKYNNDKSIAQEILEVLNIITVRLAPVIGALGSIVTVLFMVLVYPSPRFWELVEHINLKYDNKYNLARTNIWMHVFGLPLALIDIFYLKQLRNNVPEPGRPNGPITGWDIGLLGDMEIFGYEEYLDCPFLQSLSLFLLLAVYYVVLVNVNTKCFGAGWPYEVLAKVDEKGCCAWVGFTIAVVIFGSGFLAVYSKMWWVLDSCLGGGESGSSE